MGALWDVVELAGAEYLAAWKSSVTSLTRKRSAESAICTSVPGLTGLGHWLTGQLTLKLEGFEKAIVALAVPTRSSRSSIVD